MFRKTHTRSTKSAEPIGDGFKSNNIAARMGRWSASHWKTAVFAWLAFVVLAFATSIFFPLQLIEQKDADVGESAQGEPDPRQVRSTSTRTAQRRAVRGLIQSKTKTVDDPAFRAVIDESLTRCSGFPKVREAALAARRRQRGPDLARPSRGPDRVHSRAGPTTRRRTTSTRSPPPPTGVQKAHPGFYVGEARRLDREGARQADPRRARPGRHDLDPADDPHPAARARVARGRVRAGRWSG